MVGLRFGRLTVLSLAENYCVQCVCDCGKRKKIAAHSVRSGVTRSCGCIHSEITSARNRKHGLHGSTEWATWISMRQRCRDYRSSVWKKYGARGITICERWNTFVNFLQDMGKKPFPEAQIDRINNDGNYEPENCRWTSRKENCRNRRSTRFVTLNGITKSLAEWCDNAPVSYQTVHRRLRSGWSMVSALMTPKYSTRVIA